ncbi:STT3 domain-containing protein [[Eubacterium] cellulosolvens]
MSNEIEYGEKSSISERLGSRIRALRKVTHAISKHTLLHYTILFLILTIATIIRSLPIRWGFYLSEFDPYFQYKMADFIVKNNFASWYSWHDNMSWYPWGRDVPETSYPGLAFTAALLHEFLNSIGIELTIHQVCVVFPVIMGTLTCLVVYFLGKEIWGTTVGLLSALFLAFSSSHIFRTSLGFFDGETIGIFAMVLSFLFYLKAIQPERTTRSSLFYSLLAGLCLSYLSFGWGAFRYPLSLLALFTFILVLTGRGSSKLFISYAMTFGFAFLTMAQLPKIGYAFFYEITAIAVFIVFSVLLIREISVRVEKISLKTISIGIILFALIIAGFVFWKGEMLEPLAGKFFTILFPSTRSEMPLVESVAEHRMATWATFFREFGAIALFGVFGLYFLLQKLRDQDLFLLIFGISSLYFASSLVRLSLILAPAVSILAAIAITELGKPSVDIIRGTVIFPKRKIRFVSKVGREYGIAILFLFLLLIAPTINNAVNAAQAPATIATSSLPTITQQPQDWLEALSWMRDNLPENAVVFAWWDYGYWITTLGDKHSLADNGTINTTQITMIARTFLSNETRAVPILKQYDVTHIAILVTWYWDEEINDVRYYGFGEDSKWYWMARISNGSTYQGETVHYYSKRVGEDEDSYLRYDRVITIGDKIISNDTIVDKLGLNPDSLLGDLIFRGISTEYPIESEFTNLVFKSSNFFVFIYRVQYPNPTLLSCNLSNSSITYGQSTTVYGELLDYESKGIPAAPILLQYSENNGTSWDGNYSVATDSYGKYEYELNPSGGELLVRAKWNGTSGVHQSSTSLYKPLLVKKATGTFSMYLSPSTIYLGDSVNITCTFDPPSLDGIARIEYRYGADQNWTSTVYGYIDKGKFTTSWTPENEGTYYIRAKFEASKNYEDTISDTIKLDVILSE